MALMDFSLGASDPNNPNSVVLTPQQQQARLAAALAQQKEGSNTSPIQSPWQGAARLAQGLMGGLEAGHIERQQAAATKGANDQLGSLIAGLGGAAPSASASASPASPVSQSVPTFASIQGGDVKDAASKIYGGFYAHALSQGADPATATEFANMGLGVADREGLHAKNLWGNSGDGGKSWGPMQLLVGGGVGDEMHGNVSPDNQIKVAAKTMWGEPGTGGYYNTAPWNGAGDYISGRGQVGNSALNDSERAQTAMVERGQKLAAAAHLSPAAYAAQLAPAPAQGAINGATPVQVASNNPGFVPSAGGPPAAAAAVPLPPPRPANLTPAADDGEEDTPAPTQVAGPGAPTAAAPAAAPAPAPQAPAQNQAQLKAALAIMQNPYSSPAAQQIAGAVLQQAMKQDSYSQPYKDQFGNVVQRAANGKIEVLNKAAETKDTQTNDIKNFEYAKKNGFTGNFTDFETQQKGQAAGNHVIGTGGALVDPNGKVLYQNQGNGGFDDATVGALADRVISGESGVLVGLGRGAQGSENIGKIQASVAQKMAAANMPPDAIAKARADIAGKMQEQRTLGTSTANNTLYGDTAAAAMDTALKASASVPRGRWAPLNALANMGMKAWSDPDYGAFLTANNTLVSEYAKATSPVGSPTDSQRAHAFELLSTADSPEKYDRVVRMMHQEIENTHKAIGQAKTQLKSGNFELPALQTPPPAASSSPGFFGTIGNAIGLGGGSAPAPASPPVIQDEAAFKALPSGAQFIGPDGKPYRKP
jgi:hypothetical protein